MNRLTLVLAGAPFDTGNRGVEALGRSVIDAVDKRAENLRRDSVELTVLDHGWGLRPDVSGRYQNARVVHLGVRLSRRWHRRESWAQIRLAQLVSPRMNPAASRIQEASALLDISGGDSFTDMYGAERLATVSAPKRAAIRAGTPLVLLPQTYGPFDSAAGRSLARALIRGSAIAYARDPLSYDRLLELAGDSGDTSRCRRGVDVAFGLRPRKPRLEPRLAALLDGGDGCTVGINLSGLLCQDSARSQFALAGDYLTTMTTLVRRLIDGGAYVVFVPHVHVPDGGGESDIVAVSAVRERLTGPERTRTAILPEFLDAAELKWCMAKLDWMLGSRMHSTIGALSQQIPTYGYAYSDKMTGVFETCGVREQVADAREVCGDEAVERMMDAFARRDEMSKTLEAVVPDVIDTAQRQLADVIAAVESWRDGVPAGSIG